MIYKEQRSPRALPFLVPCCQSSPLSGGQQQRVAIGRALITKPVSYTHLDVYKRQPFIRHILTPPP